jgi:hypothetical protein
MKVGSPFKTVLRPKQSPELPGAGSTAATPSPPAKPLEQSKASNDIAKDSQSKNKSGNTQHQPIFATPSPTPLWRTALPHEAVRSPPTGRSNRRARIPTFRSQPDFISEANKNSWITPDMFEAPEIIQEISFVDPKREENLIRYFKYRFPIVTLLGTAHSLYKGYEDITNFKNNLKNRVRMKQILKEVRDQQAELDRLNALEAQQTELARQNVIRVQNENLERLRAEQDAVLNDFHNTE